MLNFTWGIDNNWNPWHVVIPKESILNDPVGYIIMCGWWWWCEIHQHPISIDVWNIFNTYYDHLWIYQHLLFSSIISTYIYIYIYPSMVICMTRIYDCVYVISILNSSFKPSNLWICSTSMIIWTLPLWDIVWEGYLQTSATCEASGSHAWPPGPAQRLQWLGVCLRTGPNSCISCHLVKVESE